MSRPEGEGDRLLAAASAGLRRVGVTAPTEHLFACTSAKVTALLVKRTPFTKDEIGVLRRHCKKSKFTEALAPDQAPSEQRRRILEGASPQLTATDGLTDLTATTDDRPFFFQTVAARSLPRILGAWSTLRVERQSLFTAVLLLVVGLVLAALLVVVGVVARGGATGPSAPRGRPLLHFLGLGAGLVLAQSALVPRLVAFLAHPRRGSPSWWRRSFWPRRWGAAHRIDRRRSPRPRLGQPRAAPRRAARARGPWPSPRASTPPPASARRAPRGRRARRRSSRRADGRRPALGVKLVAPRSPELVPRCWGSSVPPGRRPGRGRAPGAECELQRTFPGRGRELPPRCGGSLPRSRPRPHFDVNFSFFAVEEQHSSVYTPPQEDHCSWSDLARFCWLSRSSQPSIGLSWPARPEKSGMSFPQTVRDPATGSGFGGRQGTGLL